MCLARGRCSVNIGRLDYWVSTGNREVDLLLDSRLKGEKLKGVFGSFRPFSWAAGPGRALGPGGGRGLRVPLLLCACDSTGSFPPQGMTTDAPGVAEGHGDVGRPGAAPGAWGWGGRTSCPVPWHLVRPDPCGIRGGRAPHSQAPRFPLSHSEATWADESLPSGTPTHTAPPPPDAGDHERRLNEAQPGRLAWHGAPCVKPKLPDPGMHVLCLAWGLPHQEVREPVPAESPQKTQVLPGPSTTEMPAREREQPPWPLPQRPDCLHCPPPWGRGLAVRPAPAAPPPGAGPWLRHSPLDSP